MDLLYSHHPQLNHAVQQALENFEKIGLLAISGASGAGKSFLARQMHGWSSRGPGPFLAQDAAALVEGRFESQLFGHVKGAFSGATRDFAGLVGGVGEGTLCLEGLEELSPPNQAKMLRFLQTRSYRPVGGLAEKSFLGGLILTSREPLNDLRREGRLRSDFYFRISSAELFLPSLGERPRDFMMLATRLAESVYSELDLEKPAPSDDELAVLQRSRISGNLHGLRNLIQGALIRGVPFAEMRSMEAPSRLEALPDRGSLKEDLKQLEALLLRRALRLHPHSRHDLARHLGISKRTLMYKLKEHGLR